MNAGSGMRSSKGPQRLEPNRSFPAMLSKQKHDRPLAVGQIEGSQVRFAGESYDARIFRRQHLRPDFSILDRPSGTVAEDQSLGGVSLTSSGPTSENANAQINSTNRIMASQLSEVSEVGSAAWIRGGLRSRRHRQGFAKINTSFILVECSANAIRIIFSRLLHACRPPLLIRIGRGRTMCDVTVLFLGGAFC